MWWFVANSIRSVDLLGTEKDYGETIYIKIPSFKKKKKNSSIAGVIVTKFVYIT